MELPRRNVLLSLAAVPIAGPWSGINPAPSYVRRIHELALVLIEEPLSARAAGWARAVLVSAERLLPLDAHNPYPAFHAIADLTGCSLLVGYDAAGGRAAIIAQEINRLACDLADRVHAAHEQLAQVLRLAPGRP